MKRSYRALLFVLCLPAVFLAQIKTCDDIVFPTLNSSLYQGVYYNDLKWENNREITVSFINGSAFVQGKVKQHVQKWSQYGNVRFRFISGTPGDIRISFYEGQGSWSLIGRQSETFSVDINTGNAVSGKGGPSMNFGWFDESTEDVEFQRTILHEFGHALGLLHEHLNPLSGIRWNEAKVYAYYMQTQNWSKEMVDRNVLNKYSVTQTNNTYDPKSIMHYPVSKELTLDNYEVGWNNDLSSQDKEFIAKLYPFTSTVTPVNPTNPTSPTEPTEPEETGDGSYFYITDLSYGDATWSLVMSKVEGDFEQEWYTGSEFPENEIAESFERGNYITHIAYGDGEWAVVLSEGMGYEAQQWFVGEELPEEDMQALFDEGYWISTITYGNGQWAIVMSLDQDGWAQQWYTSTAFPVEEINQAYKEGYMISNLTYGNDQWLLVTGENVTQTAQIWRTRDHFPKDEIDEFWAKGYDITNLTYAGDRWVLVMTQDMGFVSQSWRTREEFPEEEINDLWGR